jgi:RNA 2',3'-cyclic 3'-phosphodiesterase
MRIFTGLELPVEALEEVQRIQTELRKQIECRKWQSLKNMHLTLHFLGEKNEVEVDAVKGIMQDVCSSLHSFPLQLNGLGAFPNRKSPRVIWTGIGDVSGGLLNLQKKLAEPFEEQGLYKEDRAYSPHITLGREAEKGKNYTAILDNLHLKNIGWTAHEVFLFRSTLTPSGAIYEKIGTCPLKT